MLLVQWLRFFGIILGIVVGGFCGFLIWSRQTKSLTFSPTSWNWNLIIFLAISFIAVGVPLAMYDSVTFDWGQYNIVVSTSGIILTGDVVSFGIYWDVTATASVNEILWGEIEAGKKGTVEVYIKNEGLVDLYCQAYWLEDSWNPPGAFQYFNMGWSFGDTPIQPGRIRKVLVELQVSPDIEGVDNFAFTIEVHGDDVPPP